MTTSTRMRSSERARTRGRFFVLLAIAAAGLAGLFATYGFDAAAATTGGRKLAALAGMGTVSGTVVAPRPFKAAQVYLRNVDKRIQYMVFTNAGEFRAVALFPGRYELTARAVGLGSATQKLVVKAGDSSGLKLTMRETKDPRQFPSSVDPKTVHLFNAAGWNDPAAPVAFGSYDEIYPPGPGRVVLETVCFNCHGENTFALTPRSEDAWKFAVDYMRGTWLGEQDRDKFGMGLLAGSASNFRFGLQDRKDVIDYLTKHVGPNQPSRAVRTDPEVPFDEAELGKAQLIEYYVGYEAKPNAHQTATVGSESDVRAVEDQHMLITLQLDTDGNAWAVDRAVPSQLVRLDPRTGEQRFYVLPDPRAGVHDLVIDRQGMIWVTEFTRNPDGTGDEMPSRLLGFNPATQKWEHMLNADPDEVIRSTHKGPLMAPTVDSKGNIYMNWMLAGAIAKWDPANRKMSVFRVPTPGATPYGATIDAYDNVWAALWNGGKLAKFDTTVEQWTEFTPPTYPANLRRGPGTDSANNVWVGIWAGGPRPGKIAKLDQKTGRWSEWTIPHRGAQPYETTADKDDNIWFPETGGPDLPSVIGRLDPRTGKFTFYPKLQFVADASRLNHTVDGAVWYAPRYGAPAGHSGFGVLYPDKDKITTLAAYPLNGPPGYAFRLQPATASAR